MTTMGMTHPSGGVFAAARKWWWMFLVTGALWLILSLIVLRFNAASLTTIAVLFGIIAIAAGFNEFFVGTVVDSWRWLHYVLGGLFVVVGVVALFNPGRTFWALASIIGWFLLLKGALDITVSIMSRRVSDAWWLGLIAGIIEVGMAFWAAGGFGRKVVLLVVWVGVACMARGITEIVTAFRVKRLSEMPEELVAAEMSGYAETTVKTWPAARESAPGESTGGPRHGAPATTTTGTPQNPDGPTTP